MTENEKRKLQSDYFWYQKMMEIYTLNKEKMFRSESDYQDKINEILDEMLEIKEKLKED